MNPGIDQTVATVQGFRELLINLCTRHRATQYRLEPVEAGVVDVWVALGGGACAQIETELRRFLPAGIIARVRSTTQQMDERGTMRIAERKERTMKDKNGFDVRVGDVLQYVDGHMKIVKSLYPAGAHGSAGFQSLDGGGCDTEHHWTILRRADGSVPEKCSYCGGSGWNCEKQALECPECKRAGSIDRKPETKEQPTSDAKDKWGRLFRDGDLCRHVGSGDIFRIQGSRLVNRAGESCERSCLDAIGRFQEVIARGRPEAEVPESFDPARDADGRPFLLEFCDGCGAQVDIAHAGLVYGKPGYVCSRCAAQTKYPPDEVLEVDTRSGCNQINLPAPTFRVSGACDCCRNDSPKLTPGVLHGKVASLCGPCSALDGDDWIGAMARGLAALWDRREAFEAFCKRAVAAVHEVAPQASAIADHFDVGGAEAWNVFVNAPGREQCVVRCYPEWQDPEPYIRAVVTAWLEGKP